MRNTILKISLFLMVSILLVMVHGYGQIQGSVMSSAREPIVNAVVIVTHSSTNARDTARSDKRGFYIFKELAAGKYKVIASATGFKSSIIENVEVIPKDASDEQSHHDISNDTRLEIVLRSLKER